MNDDIQKLDKNSLLEIKEHYRLYKFYKKRVDELENCLADCQAKKNKQLELNYEGCSLSRNIDQLDYTYNKRLHQVKGKFDDNKKILYLAIDNNVFETAHLNDYKYYDILFKRTSKNLKKGIFSLSLLLSSIILESLLKQPLIYIMTIITAGLSIKNFCRYVDEKPQGNQFCGKLSQNRLNRFSKQLEKDLEKAKQESLELHECNTSFLNKKEEIIFSMMDSYKKGMKRELKIIDEILPIDNVAEEINSNIKTNQFVKKNSLYK